ncbi:fimbrillin family protein [Prevotella jejuni]|uniref:fimbrillin family protein n=1 Tax=Prevotella jejuni TaxID=1177574 RepID=UPI0028E1FE9F|nr:fimbrillin family protein [Prevotella jejuni]
MTFKKIYGIILGAVVAGLTSCSSELSSEGNATVNPNQTARRALTIAVGDGGTRSVVSLETNGNKWENGDLFGAANMTTPGNLEKLTAKGSGASTKLEGNIDCANGDKIGVFFPYKLSTGQDQKLVEISMNNGIVSTNGKPAEYKQNGTIENLKYFDYSFGTTNVQVNADGSAKATGSVNMEKQYAVLGLKFTVTKNSTTSDITENVKKVTMSNVADEAVFKMVTGTLENKSELGTINIETSNLNRIYVAVFPDDNFSPKFTVETNDNKTYTVSVSGKKVEAAAYYPITVEVKEYIPNPPYIEIAGVKWGKSNLQYTPDKKTDGWVDGYHLAANPWDYFYTESSPMNLEPNVIKIPSTNAENTKFDHFRWGDISKAHSFAYGDKDHYDSSVANIEKKNSNNEYGDIACYASKGDWRLPNAEEFKKLMENTTEYIGYYPSEAGDVLGVLFVPDGVAHGKIIGKNGQFVANSNVTGNIQGFSGKKYQTSTIVRKFTAEEISKGIFFPAAGTFTNYSSGLTNLNNAGRMGYYWTADCFNDKQAKSFTFQFTANGRVMFATVGNSNAGTDLPPKNNMYSIRPIYIGD